jgi:5-carboxymethyl-2-hydroxymuconate isomerase
MPHLVILYSGNIESETDISGLCRKLADTMIEQRDEHDKPVFPIGGVRVLAYPAPHHAVADGQRDYAFAYLNLRRARGRSEAVKKRTGDALAAVARAHFEPLMARRLLGITVQVDEGPEVYDAKHSNIHPLFQKT